MLSEIFNFSKSLSTMGTLVRSGFFMNKTNVFSKTVSSIEGTSTGFTDVIFHLFMNTFDVSHKSTMLSKFFVTIMALVIFELFVHCERY